MEPRNFLPGNLKYTTGDATVPAVSGMKFIIHIVNDQGGFGAGFAGAVAKKWPKAREDYRRWYASQEKFKLGEIYLSRVQSDVAIVHMLAQHQIMQDEDGNPPLRLEALGQCLEKVAKLIKEEGQGSVHCPRIGAGLSSGITKGYSTEVWKNIENLLKEKLINKSINVTVYDLPEKP